MENAQLANKRQISFNERVGRERSKPDNIKYNSIVMNASLKREVNNTKNYSINSRFNNSRPMINLAKNLQFKNKKNVTYTDNSDQNQEDSLENISMESF